MILIVLMIFSLLLLGGLLLFVAIFRYACRAAGLENPGIIKATGVVISSFIVWSIVEFIFSAILREVYTAIGSPWWEVIIIAYFVGLPVSLMVASLLHVVLLRVSLSKAIQVWFVERLIRFSILLVAAGLIAVFVLAVKK